MGKTKIFRTFTDNLPTIFRKLFLTKLSRQESEVQKNDNRTGGTAVSDRYPKPQAKPNYLQS